MFDSFEQAERELRKRQADTDAIRRRERAAPPPEKGFGELADYWLEHRAAGKRSRADMESIIRRLRLAFGKLRIRQMGVIARPTKDCDVLDPALPEAIRRAAHDFAATQAIEQLQRGWFNNGRASLIRTLPPEWSGRLQRLYSGRALELLTLAREDLLQSKLFALVDRNIDLPDCVVLRPTREELHVLLPWLDEQDGNEEWPRYVRMVLGQLAQELGYEL